MERVLQAARSLTSWRVLLVTFGTSRVYRLLPDRFVVGNCHREPAARFVEEDLSVDDILSQWQPLLHNLFQRNPSLQVVFTVSPYRYVKYGLHGSQLSKARLLLAVDALCQRFAACRYFPAYEIVIDELRDYRFSTAIWLILRRRLLITCGSAFVGVPCSRRLWLTCSSMRR